MTKKEIKDDLLEQLEAQGKYQNYYLDLIEDYMKYYDLKRKCQQDIKKKGLRYIKNYFPLIFEKDIVKFKLKGVKRKIYIKL